MIARCLAEVLQGSTLGIIGSFGLIPLYGVLGFAYFWVRRWDQAWLERWERKHGQSRDVLRERIAKALKTVRLILWIFGGMILLEALTGLDVFLPVIRGETLTDLQIMTFCSKARSIVHFALLLGAGVLTITIFKYELRKIDRLSGHQS